MPHLIGGRPGPSNTTSNVTGNWSSCASLKNRLRSSGFSPAWAWPVLNANWACESHTLNTSRCQLLDAYGLGKASSTDPASIPRMIVRRPCLSLTKPSFTAISLMALISPQGSNICQMKSERSTCWIQVPHLPETLYAHPASCCCVKTVLHNLRHVVW